MNRQQIDGCIDYIRRHPEVRDVLLSGGDALMIRDELLEYIIASLRAIEHVEIIRIGSRVPVVMPQRITPDLVEFISDTTPAKQGRLSPGQHIPVREYQAFAGDHPDYALLFAWNHADEIMNAEQAFRDAGGQWIRYVPNVHVS